MRDTVEDDDRWSRLGPPILEALDADEPRILLAQALEADEPGSLRARLIRVQVSLASLEGGMDHPEWFRLAAEARRLVQRSNGRWLPEVIRHFESPDVVFHRGLVESIALDASQLTVDVVSYIARFTAIRHLTLFGLNPKADVYTAIKILYEPALVRRLRSLQLDGQDLDDISVRAITDLRWPALHWMSLRHNRIEAEGVFRLARATEGGQLPALRYVRLDGNPVDPVEQAHEDQGVVVQTTIPAIQADLPPVPWLRRTVRHGRMIEPDRFAHRPS